MRLLPPSLLLPLAVVAGLAAACSDESGGKTSPGSPERIVLITLDTLRFDAMPGIHADKPSMPHTWEWAQGGRIFERYYSATSTTQPSHATLFTGLHPWQHGVSHNGAVLADGLTTVAERLHAAGWRTAAAVASFPLYSTFGFNQGFDEYRETFNKGETEQWSGHEVTAEGGFFGSGDLILKESLDLLDHLGGKKQFFWFHFFDAHAPYGDRVEGYADLNPTELIRRIRQSGGPPGPLTRAARGAYDKDVRQMDRELRDLFARLEADGIPTHVIVVSDHGESFGESGSLGHGKRLTPEQIHVPLIVKSPRVKPGVVSTPVGSIDVNATLLSLAGLDGAPAGSRDLTSDAPLEDHPVIGMRRTYTKYSEERTDGSIHKITKNDNRFYIVEDGQLYTGNKDLVSHEDDELPISDTERTARYSELFGGFEQQLLTTGSEELQDAETLEKLKTLGYVDDEDQGQ